ncbi:S8 family serine peptidase [Methylosinus sp. Sm6]|uniref:S8 family peptidase n=1 Tax=Methylosinus sp. Sm6 TaxID=2866948 RepID=UPI001C99DB52|nr:S8 family serine peptidase [Methylosinus sp. Sm6]MBY6243811.1 S8 family serine peptidase [Methylosinus sp. Sm6]
MFRFAIVALAAAALSSSAHAETKGVKVDPAIAAKTGTADEIGGALADKGTVRVLVVVKPSSGATVEDVTAAGRVPASRAAIKQQVTATLDSVLSAHKFSHVGGGKGSPAIVRLKTIPAFSAVVDAAELAALAKDPSVVSIEYDRPMKKHLSVTVPFIGMTSVYSAGGAGSGYAVAVIDDGIQRNHPFIGTSRLYPGREACILDTNDCPNGTNEQIGTGASAAAAGASHGMHTSGIAVGNRASGTPKNGVARSAKLVPINIFGPNDGVSQSTILRAFEHVEDLVMESSGSNPLKIASINMSVGGGGSVGVCDGDADMKLLKPVIDNLRKKGVLATVSAGNDGERAKTSFPGCLSTIVSVAATSRKGVVASYTNINQSTDLFAPGGEFDDCVVSSVPTSAFGAKCGTSMAAPHVAGAIATLKQLNPKATACQIENALKTTGLPTSDIRSGGLYTKPLIRVNEARLRLKTPVAPSNDKFASALVIPAHAWRYTTDGANVGATLETGEPSHVGTTAARSVWWKWTPNVAGPVTIDTLGSGFDTVVAVYRGATSVTSRGTVVATNDNISSTVKQSRVTFNALAGQTYHIVVAGKRATEECSITLNVSRPPLNNNFAQATVVKLPVATEVGVAGSNDGATKETGEPSLNGDAANTSTVWFRFTAPETGVLYLDTSGSPTLTDTVLAVYKGAALDALTLVAVNDDIVQGVNTASRLNFGATAGATYYVQLSGWHGAQGRYYLWFTPAGAQSLDHAKTSLAE